MSGSLVIMKRFLCVLGLAVVLGGCESESEPTLTITKMTDIAEQGDADAQVALGVIYATGSVVPKDEKEAVKWYRKAAEQRNATAQYSLGIMYYHGKGVAKDEVEAVKWIRKAAEQGLRPAKEALKELGVE